MKKKCPKFHQTLVDLSKKSLKKTQKYRTEIEKLSKLPQEIDKNKVIQRNVRLMELLVEIMNIYLQSEKEMFRSPHFKEFVKCIRANCKKEAKQYFKTFENPPNKKDILSHLQLTNAQNIIPPRLHKKIKNLVLDYKQTYQKTKQMIEKIDT